MLLPLFPLPGVVLFPGARLPLHVFEPRYRSLVADLLEQPPGQRRIGMILAVRGDDGGIEMLEPGCAGRLVEHRALADGRSDIVLEGEFRFAVEREVAGRPYRRAVVHALPEEIAALDAERAAETHAELLRLSAAVARASGGRSPIDAARVARLADPDRLPALANCLAAGLDLPPLRKQTLLAEAALDRARELAGILRSRLRLLEALAPYRGLAERAEEN